MISTDNANRGSDVGASRATRPEPCVPFGAGRPRGLWPKRRTRAGRQARRLHLCQGIETHPSSTRMHLESNTDGFGRTSVGSRQFRRRTRRVSNVLRHGWSQRRRYEVR